MSKPEWKVTYADGKVAIRSNNFTHDAVLYLTGDFATHEVAISYASKLVAKLNADLSRIEAETEARVLGRVITAIRAERVSGETGTEGDVAYNVALEHAEDAIRALSFQCADGGHCGDGGYCDECPHRDANEKQVEGYVPTICSTHGVQYTPTKMPIGLVYSCPKCMIQASPDTDVSTEGGLIDVSDDPARCRACGRYLDEAAPDGAEG